MKRESDLKRYVRERKKRDPKFAAGYDEGYEAFKVAMMLRRVREKKGITQERLAEMIHTKKTCISRMENHCGDMRFSTICRIARALGKRLELKLA